MKRTIHLGYATGTGEPVAVPVAHMVVTGQTQQSGKTTTLEAMVTRGAAQGLRALAFKTKRGERTFEASSRVVRPYFREQTDWQFVASLLEASRGERMKFERSWIMKACRGARSLAQVQRNVAKLQAASKRAMDSDMFMMLGAYLDEIVPQLARLPMAPGVELNPGVNVMDLVDYPRNLQQLVVASSLRWIHEREEDVISIVPEAWKFIPQGLNSPVKSAARSIAREGAGIGNLLWMDMQDLAGGEKEMLRGVTVWLLGVQREANEIKRTLSNIPEGIKRPRAGEIAQLKVGEFFACWGDEAIRTYVQPAWMAGDTVQEIARGTRTILDAAPGFVASVPSRAGFDYSSVPPEDLRPTRMPAIPTPLVDTALLAMGERLRTHQEMQEEDEMNPEQEKKLDVLIKSQTELAISIYKLVRGDRSRDSTAKAQRVTRDADPIGVIDEDALVERVVARLKKEAPAIFRTLSIKPELHVREERREVTFEDGSLKAKIAQLYQRGWFKDPRKAGDVFKELSRLGHKTANPRVWEAMKEMATLGLFFVDDNAYTAQPDVKVVVERA